MSSDSSLGSEDLIWPRSRRNLFVESPATRVAAQTQTTQIASQTCVDPLDALKPSPAETQVPKFGTFAGEFSTGENVLLVRIEQVRDSVLVQLALDAFILFVAWAPFTFYGALLFVVAQRAALVAGERYLLHGQIK